MAKQYNVRRKTDLKVLGYRELSLRGGSTGGGGGGGVVARVSVMDRDENRGSYPHPYP